MTSAQTQATDAPKSGFDIAAYVAIVRRRWMFVAAVTIVGFAAAWFLAPKSGPRLVTSGPAQYKATNTVLQLGDGGKLSLDRVKFLSTLGEVPRRVAQRIGYTEDPSLLTSEIEINTDGQVGSISFTTTQTTPELAKELADAWASETLAYVASVQTDALRTQAQDIRDQIAVLDEQLASPEVPFRQTLTSKRANLAQQAASIDQQLTRQSGASADSGLMTVEPAEAQAAAAEVPKTAGTGKIGRPIWLAMATVMALILGIAGAILLDRLDKRLHSREEVEGAYDEPVLAEIPTGRGQAISIMDPQSATAESMRMLRTVLLTTGSARASREVRLEDGHLATAQANGSNRSRSVLVTSASPGDGKTNTALNLAMAFTEQQFRVLLVDADLRNADASEYFGMGTAAGVSDLANARMTDAQTIASTCRATDNPYLFLLPAGTARERPSVLLHGVRDVIETARAIVDVVVVDSAALLVTNDTRELFSAVDGVLLAVTLGVSTAPAAEDTRELIERLSPPMLGIALLGANTTSTRTMRKWQRKHPRTSGTEAGALKPPPLDQAPVTPTGVPSEPAAPSPAPVPGHGR